MQTKILNLTAILIFVISFTSCNSDNTIMNEIDQSKSVNNVEIDSTQIIYKSISFNISYPKDNTGVQTYSYEQEDANIKSLYLMVFDTDGKCINNMEVTNYVIQQKTTNTGTINVKYNFHEYKGYIYINDLKLAKTKCKFLFVANHKIGDNFNESDLNNQYISDVISSDNINANGLPMSGYALQNSSEIIDITKTTGSIDVILVRALARVDIENHSNDLIITSASLHNTAEKVWIYNKESDDEDDTETKTEFLSPLKIIDKTHTFIGGNILTSAFYFYPNKYSKVNNAPYLHLEGTYKTKNIKLDIPFYKDKNTTSTLKCATNYYSLHRNSKYKVVLGETATEAYIQSAFTITPWSIINIEEIIDTNNFD